MLPVSLSDVFRIPSSALRMFRGGLGVDFNVTLH